MELNERINAFSELGQRLSAFLEKKDKMPRLKKAVSQSALTNPWFTVPFQMLAIENIATWLNKEDLEKWTNRYVFPDKNSNIGVIMAGNIPLVGFHDFLSTLICGHTIYVKLSSKDKSLLPAIADELMEINPAFKEKVFFIAEIPENIDAIIATGSTNTARYFDFYFKNKPRIIRQNRSSVGVLTGNEKKRQLEDLAADICSYYGLGCRNISKLFIPDKKMLKPLTEALEKYSWILNNRFYANTLTYHKARLQTQDIPFIEAGPVLLTESDSLHSPVSIVNYEVYQDIQSVQKKVELDEKKIQCTVGFNQQNSLTFGEAQQPELNDYADNVDTMKFLSEVGN